MLFQVSDRRVGYILNKRENATPESYAFICKMMQASIANESVSECDWVMHYGCFHEETHESHLNVTGVQFIRLQI